MAPQPLQTELETKTGVSLSTKISVGYMVATAVLVLVSVVATAIWTIAGSRASATLPQSPSSLEQPQNNTFTFTATE